MDMLIGFCIGLFVGANLGLVIFSLFALKNGAHK